jgi:hypothetical protein
MRNQQKIWDPYRDERGFDKAMVDVFANFGSKALESKYPTFERAVSIQAWNIQVESKVRARTLNRSKPLSLDSTFYTYVLLDPRKPGSFVYEVLGKRIKFLHEPFYVGKGFGDRIEYHIAEARKNPSPTPKDHKGNKIKKLLRLGLEPILRKVSSDTIESVALVKEMLLINAIGRAVTGDGPLTNKSLGGEGQRGVVLSETQRLERVARPLGKKSPEHSERMKRIWADANFRQLMSAKHKGRPKSEEHKAKIGAANRKPKSEQGRANMRGVPRKRIACPHCPVTGLVGNMHRWHFDNCKHKEQTC